MRGILLPRLHFFSCSVQLFSCIALFFFIFQRRRSHFRYMEAAICREVARDTMVISLLAFNIKGVQVDKGDDVENEELTLIFEAAMQQGRRRDGMSAMVIS